MSDLTLLRKIHPCIISLSMLLCCSVTASHALDFACADDLPAAEYRQDTTAEDILYAETISYLRGFVNILTEKAAACGWGAEIVTQSHFADRKTCLNQKEDVVTLIEQSQVILDYPEVFRACFDTQKDYDTVEYSKNHLLQNQ